MVVGAAIVLSQAAVSGAMLGASTTSPVVSMVTRHDATLVAPSVTSVTPGFGEVTVTWSEPVDSQPLVDAYLVVASPGDEACEWTVGPTVCTIDGLTGGTSYSFVVTAFSSSGAGPVSSVPATAIPYGTPGVATKVALASKSAALVASWIAAPANGAKVTSYVATATPGGSTCSTATTTCTLTGLANGTTYSVSIVATNVAGSGLSSTPVSGEPVGPPLAPTVTGTSWGFAQVVVSWHPPATNGGAPLTKYIATASPGGAQCTVLPARSGSLATTCSVKGLVNEKLYQFTVAAWNKFGASPSSPPSSPTAPHGPPSSPFAVVAQSGDHAAVVSWSAPKVPGSGVTLYSVASNPSGLSCTSSTTTCDVKGLVNGKWYTFTVLASASSGNSVPSSPSLPSLIGLPWAPSIASVNPGDSKVVIYWQAAGPDAGGTSGGSPTAYVALASPGGEKCAAGTVTPTGCTITGLTNGTHYSVSLTAIDHLGHSPSVLSSSFVPSTLPGIPTGVTAVGHPTSATVKWAAPTTLPADAITAYTVLADGDGGSQSCTWTSGPLQCTVTGLKNGTSYTFTVAGTNLIGVGAASTPTSPIVPIDVTSSPQMVTGIAGDTSIAVSWSAPAVLNGSPVQNYVATANPGGQTCQPPGATLSCTITGLTNGTSYTVSVAASNGAGSSPASSPSTAVVPVGVPTSPQNVSATSGNSQASVSWQSPTLSNGAAIIDYTATATPGGATCATATTACTITGLQNGTTYTFTVTARNVAGSSQPSSASAGVVPATVPDAPPSFSVYNVGPYGATVSWGAPNNEGSAITGYVVNGLPGCGGTTGTSCGTGSLQPSSGYYVCVYATNGIGSGPSSCLSFGTAPRPTVTEWTGGVTHTWTDYNSAGGSQGPSIPAFQGVQIQCRRIGFAVADGNPWWYQVASSPWNGSYWASADPFYNNGATGGSLHGTPWVDPNVPQC